MPTSAIGAQLFTVRDYTKTPDDLRQTFAKVRALGYEAVQASALGSDLASRTGHDKQG